MNFVVSLACIKMGMTPEEAINAATINAAYALNLSRLIFVIIVLLNDVGNRHLTPISVDCLMIVSLFWYFMGENIKSIKVSARGAEI